MQSAGFLDVADSELLSVEFLGVCLKRHELFLPGLNQQARVELTLQLRQFWNQLFNEGRWEVGAARD